MVWWHILIICVVSYFIGNISFSRFLAKTKKKDITKLGSGNAGSTNVLRNFGLGMGVLNLALDIFKGFLPSILAYYIFGQNIIYLYIAGICAMIGHIYPVIYKFKGGKGIASMLGVFLAADWWVTLIVIGVALVCWLIFKYGSLSSFVCVTALTVVEGLRAKSAFNAGIIDAWQLKILSMLLFAIFCLTWYAHRSNIERLLCGRESKVSLIKSTKLKLKLEKLAEQRALKKMRQQKIVQQTEVAVASEQTKSDNQADLIKKDESENKKNNSEEK